MRLDLSRIIGPRGSRSGYVWSAVLYFVVTVLAMRLAVNSEFEGPLAIVPFAAAAYFAFRGAVMIVAAIKAGESG